MGRRLLWVVPAIAPERNPLRNNRRTRWTMISGAGSKMTMIAMMMIERSGIFPSDFPIDVSVFAIGGIHVDHLHVLTP